MAEHFAFEQGLGDSAQVDFDERRLAALAVLVDRFGDQLLARAAFAGNQYGRRGACDARSRVEHLRQQRRPADDAFAPEYRLRSAFRRAGLFFTLFVDLDRRSDRIQQCEVVPGFGYEVESPGPDAPDGQADRSPGGNQDDRDVRTENSCFPQQFESFFPRRGFRVVHVHQDQFGALPAHEAERFVRIFRRSDFVAGAFQHQGQ